MSHRIVIPQAGASNDVAPPRAIYSDITAAVLQQLGQTSIARASHVEVGKDLTPAQRQMLSSQFVQNTAGQPIKPEYANRWFACMYPVNGPVLGPFSTRSEALLAETDWLTAQRLPLPQ